MRSEWCYFKQYFSKEQCDQIIQEGLKLPAQRANLGVNGLASNDKYRKSTVRFITQEHKQFEWLFDAMWKMAVQANLDWFRFNINQLEYIQLAEYDSAEEGEYKKHHDVFWLNGTNYHRKLTAVVQLTDPNEYTGGELKLFNQNETINADDIKQQGSVIFFPSFVEHQAEKVTSGKRYSLAVWFDGPHWT
jgi:PKHD-type hydroxylase